MTLLKQKIVKISLVCNKILYFDVYLNKKAILHNRKSFCLPSMEQIQMKIVLGYKKILLFAML